MSMRRSGRADTRSPALGRACYFFCAEEGGSGSAFCEDCAADVASADSLLPIWNDAIMFDVSMALNPAIPITIASTAETAVTIVVVFIELMLVLISACVVEI